MESQCRSLGYRDAFAAGEECSNLDIYDNLCFSCPWVFAIIAYGEALTLILSSLRNPLCQVSSVCSVPWLSLHWWLEECFLKSWLLTTCIMSPGALLHLPGPHPIIITGTLYRSRPRKQHVNHILLAVLTNTNVSEPHICLHILTAPGVVPAPESAAC